jgi:hypothetical protein
MSGDGSGKTSSGHEWLNFAGLILAAVIGAIALLWSNKTEKGRAFYGSSATATVSSSQQETTTSGSGNFITQVAPGATVIINSAPTPTTGSSNSSAATQLLETQTSEVLSRPQAAQASVEVRKPRIYLSFDENSRYVAQYIKEGLSDVGVPIESNAKEDGPRLATIRVQSEVRDFDIDGDVTTKMYLTISTTKGDGTPVSEQNYELSGTSAIDRESALRTASSKFRETAKNLELIKVIGALASNEASNTN